MYNNYLQVEYFVLKDLFYKLHDCTSFVQVQVIYKSIATCSTSLKRSEAKSFYGLVSELRIAFNLFDKDRDGSISLQEVRSAMETLGQTVDNEKIRESFKQVDLDGKTALTPSPLFFPLFISLYPLPIVSSLTPLSAGSAPFEVVSIL